MHSACCFSTDRKHPDVLSEGVCSALFIISADRMVSQITISMWSVANSPPARATRLPVKAGRRPFLNKNTWSNAMDRSLPWTWRCCCRSFGENGEQNSRVAWPFDHIDKRATRRGTCIGRFVRLGRGECRNAGWQLPSAESATESLPTHLSCSDGPRACRTRPCSLTELPGQR